MEDRPAGAKAPPSDPPPAVESPNAGGRRRRRLMIAAAIAGAVVLLSAVFLVVFLHSLGKVMQGTASLRSSLRSSLASPRPGEPVNVLLVGADARPGHKIYRTDTLLVASIDARARTIWVVSIPRDTRVVLGELGAHKINAAQEHAGVAGVIDAVSGLLDLPIHHYAEIHMGGFQKVVDELGGIWINVPTTIDDKKAAGASVGGRASHISKGYQLLDGEHALTFVRSRAYVDADFSRIRNQQLFLRALVKQAVSLRSVPRWPDVARQVARSVRTDMDFADMARLAAAARSAGSRGFYTATLSGEWRSPFVWTDEVRKRALVAAMREGRGLDEPESGGSSQGETVSREGPSQNGTSSGHATAPPTITVSNGGGVPGAASTAAKRLAGAGFPVDRLGNAPSFRYEKTLVVYSQGSDRSAARRIAQVVHADEVRAVHGEFIFPTDILVILGSK